MLTVAVLGPVELRRDGAELAVPSGRTTELLVRLALDAGVEVRAERLVEDLWPSGAGRNTLQSKVSQLRRALGDPALVRGGGAGYTLAVDRGCVDALEVVRAAAAVTALRAAGDAVAAVREATAALALFRGELLAGAGDGAWQAPHRTRLEEARLSLTEDALRARLDLGAAGDVVGELERLVAEHPLREGFWTLLVTALYRAGRQADALDAYHRVQRRLADDLGLDPSPELQQLAGRVLRQDAGLAPVTRAAPGNVPALSASLIGRGAELATLGRSIADHRLVTLAGPAGVGKTRLAIEVARRADLTADLTGGAWLVRLESAGTEPAVWHGIGEAFGQAELGPAAVLDRLRGSPLLLVLDNCEHLVDVLPGVVARILAAAPAVRVLATSQQPLGVDGETVHVLEPLPIEEAQALFVDRAARQRPAAAPRRDTTGRDATERDVLEGEAGDAADAGAVVAAVCRSLDGLPLAIELAAARTRVLSVAEIARRLDDRFTLLSDPAGRRPARHRTLAAAIAWSYDLLFPDDQTGLWALAAFSDGAPLPAVEHVLGALGVPRATAVDVLGRLVDRSLLTAEFTGDAVRYRLLDSVREFSLDRSRAAGTAGVAERAHAAWFADAADAAVTGARGRDQAACLALVRVERANVEAALAWTGVHDPPTGLRVANGFGWAWAVLGGGTEAARRVRAALAAAGDGAPPAARTRARLLAGWLEATGGDLDRATADLDLATRTADDELRAVGALYLAFVRSQQGRPRDALELLAGCGPEFRARGMAWEEGASRLLAAWAEIALGDIERGKAACQDALRLLEPIGDQWALNHLEGMLGALAQAEHRFADAAAHLARAAEATHRLGAPGTEAHHLTNLGRAQEQGGDLVAATATLRRAVDVAHACGDRRTGALAAARLGRVLRRRGEPVAARDAARAAHDWYASAGGGEGLCLAAYVLAVLDGDAERLAGVLSEARGAGDVEVEVLSLDALARLAADAGDTARAGDLLAAADGVPAAHLVTEADRPDRAAALAELGRSGGRV